MKRITISIVVVLAILFAALGIQNLVSTNQKLKLQDVQLKTRSDKIQQLELNHDSIKQQLDTEKSKTDQNQQTIDELNKKDQENQQKIDELEQQVQARLKAKQDEIAKQNSLNSKIANAISPTAYAAADDGSAKMFIYMHESGNNPGAINPNGGACGLGQALPCSKMGCSLSDYACQDAFFTNYMLNRYGSWENAKAFWQANRWW